jgi:alkylhydroperoxidase family enzyme
MEARSRVAARIPTIPNAEWSPEMREAITALRPTHPRHVLPPGEGRPMARNALGTFAHHPVLARAWFTFNGHILTGTTLTQRQRELLVLRISVLRQSAYEWGQHVPLAQDCGVDDDEIARVAYGPDAPQWDPLDEALLRTVDELVADGVVSDETWAVLADHLEPPQLLDVIFTVGAYETIAWMFRSCALDFDPELLRE